MIMIKKNCQAEKENDEKYASDPEEEDDLIDNLTKKSVDEISAEEIEQRIAEENITA